MKTKKVRREEKGNKRKRNSAGNNGPITERKKK